MARDKQQAAIPRDVFTHQLRVLYINKQYVFKDTLQITVSITWISGAGFTPCLENQIGSKLKIVHGIQS
jgi:hypothetical protein